MSKAILIIDMPKKSCIMCPCYELESGTCQALPNDEPWDHYDINDNHIIPKDCPLKPYKEAIPIEWIKQWLSKKVFIWDATTMANEKDRLQAIENIKYGFKTMLEDWEVSDSVVVPYSDKVPNIYFETTTKEIPMTWIKAYTRTEISNADFWAITRMVTKWEEGKEIRERKRK